MHARSNRRALGSLCHTVRDLKARGHMCQTMANTLETATSGAYFRTHAEKAPIKNPFRSFFCVARFHGVAGDCVEPTKQKATKTPTKHRLSAKCQSNTH